MQLYLLTKLILKYITYNCLSNSVNFNAAILISTTERTSNLLTVSNTLKPVDHIYFLCLLNNLIINKNSFRLNNKQENKILQLM